MTKLWFETSSRVSEKRTKYWRTGESLKMMETPALQLPQRPGLDVVEEDDNFWGLRKKLFSPDLSSTSAGRNLKEPVLVYLRIRPKSLEEIANKDPDCLHCSNDQELIAVPPESSNTYKVNRNEEKATQTFAFSHIYPAGTTQKDLFEETLRPRLKDFCEGQNCLLFTYGVTNSGEFAALLSRFLQ